LVGPTASGKSAVALEVAGTVNAAGMGPPIEIVVVDSMQVYRGMDIGTAKPSPAEQGQVTHHLINLVDPVEDFDVASYKLAFDRTLGEIEARGHRALLVGGTGLYFQAAVDGFCPPGRFPEVLGDLMLESDTAALHSRLAVLDPLGASRILPGNRRRVLRAMEVSLGSGKPFSAFGPGVNAFPPTGWRLAGLWLPRAIGVSRIQARWRAMMSEGLVDETRGLLQRYGRLSRTAGQALGYREISRYLRGECSRDVAEAEALQRTQHFARRQRMWWRRDPRITWFGAPDDTRRAIPAILGEWTTT